MNAMKMIKKRTIHGNSFSLAATPPIIRTSVVGVFVAKLVYDSHAVCGKIKKVRLEFCFFFLFCIHHK